MDTILQLLELIPWFDASIIAIIIAATEALKRYLPNFNPRLLTIIVAVVASLFIYFKLDLSLIDTLVRFVILLIGSAGSYAFAIKPFLNTKEPS